MILGYGSGSWLRWKRGQFLCMAQYTFYSKESWPARGHLRANAVGVRSEGERGKQKEGGKEKHLGIVYHLCYLGCGDTHPQSLRACFPWMGRP